MKMIPYAWKMIEHRMSNDSLFEDLELKLNKYFSKKIRLKNGDKHCINFVCWIWKKD